MTAQNATGQGELRTVGLIAVAGLATSLLAFLGYRSPGEMDPVLIFLLIAYPLLIGATVYFSLQSRKAATLPEDYYIKWYLHSFAKVCLTETDLNVVREELTSSILRLIRPNLAGIHELNVGTGHLEVVHQAGMKNLPDAATQTYTFGEGIPGWVMQNLKPVILADISREQYVQIDPWAKTIGLKSYAAIPILVREKPVGIIAMYSLEPNFFNDSNILIAQIIAQIYGLSIAKLIIDHVHHS